MVLIKRLRTTVGAVLVFFLCVYNSAYGDIVTEKYRFIKGNDSTRSLQYTIYNVRSGDKVKLDLPSVDMIWGITDDYIIYESLTKTYKADRDTKEVECIAGNINTLWRMDKENIYYTQNFGEKEYAIKMDINSNEKRLLDYNRRVENPMVLYIDDFGVYLRRVEEQAKIDDAREESFYCLTWEGELITLAEGIVHQEYYVIDEQFYVIGYNKDFQGIVMDFDVQAHRCRPVVGTIDRKEGIGRTYLIHPFFYNSYTVFVNIVGMEKEKLITRYRDTLLLWDADTFECISKKDENPPEIRCNKKEEWEKRIIQDNVYKPYYSYLLPRLNSIKFLEDEDDFQLLINSVCNEEFRSYLYYWSGEVDEKMILIGELGVERDGGEYCRNFLGKSILVNGEEIVYPVNECEYLGEWYSEILNRFGRSKL